MLRSQSFLLLFCVLLLSECLQMEVPGATKTCEGNHFIFLSTFVLGLQNDLSLTFQEINNNTSIDELVYRDQLFRTYKIYNFKQVITYSEINQIALLAGLNVLRVTGGHFRVQFSFDYSKQQLGRTLIGNANGSVTADVITYEKTLQTNSSHQLQWYLSSWSPIVITNGLSITKIYPYKDGNDSQVLSNMLNYLSNNQTTIKTNLLKQINNNYSAILDEFIHNDTVTTGIGKIIEYNYIDQHGDTIISYNNTLINSTLAEDGLYLTFSQTITNDDTFQCGEKVPVQPKETQIYGGLQQFISNSLLKSTLRYAMKSPFFILDAILTEEFWQSRAFQFYMGDVHEIIPFTKNITTLTPVNGTCKSILDENFNLKSKTLSSYEVIVNFTCDFNFNKQKLIALNILVNFEVQPKVNQKKLDFSVLNVQSQNNFQEYEPYKIAYVELAQFVVAETLALTKQSGNTVFGSGYKTLNRKFPNLWVSDSYLFLYDSTQRPRK